MAEDMVMGDLREGDPYLSLWTAVLEQAIADLKVQWRRARGLSLVKDKMHHIKITPPERVEAQKKWHEIRNWLRDPNSTCPIVCGIVGMERDEMLDQLARLSEWNEMSLSGIMKLDRDLERHKVKMERLRRKHLSKRQQPAVAVEA